MGATPDLATYLQERHGFSYLLTGKLISDLIKSRFGWYRQVNGGNYFMCAKQLIQAEKKIRVLNLFQQNVLQSSSKLLTFDEIPLLPTSSKKIGFKKFDWLVTFFSELSLDELSCIDANITFFVSGYVGRSVSRRRKCSFCKEMLVKGHDPTPIYDFLPEEYTHLFDIADRSGLLKPSEFCYTVTALAVQYYSVLPTITMQESDF